MAPHKQIVIIYLRLFQYCLCLLLEKRFSPWKIARALCCLIKIGVLYKKKEKKKRKKKKNAVKTEVYENEERRIRWRWSCLHVTLKAITLFVVQATGSAPFSTGSAQIGYASTNLLCVTAKTTVATIPTKVTAVSWWLWQKWWWWWW